MRFSNLFCPTLKETPKDAEIKSHQLMIRAGLIKKLGSGLYSYLPLGYRVIQKIKAIIREELNAIYAQEVHLSSIIPAELWQESGRWDVYGKELLRIKDRHDKEFCYGPTHEEVITDLTRHHIKSYRQLPMTLYQIQTKFRDEIRPRFGVMRSREFSMKDAYSFHATTECLDQTYDTMRQAYDRIFSRCGLQFKMVEADSGAIGGSQSAEFMVTANSGEDHLIECTSCQYAANIEVIQKAKNIALTETVDIENIVNTEPCPQCSKATLKSLRGIEVGHIFKLGTKYSDAMSATFLDQQGKPQSLIMGCYGIGVARTAAAAIEQSHDDKGIVWPIGIAPFHVDIILTNTKDSDLVNVATSLYQDCINQNIDVIFDDRNDSAGMKFKDAELIGFPFQIVIGKKYQNEGLVELKIRKTGDCHQLTIQDAILTLKKLINNEH